MFGRWTQLRKKYCQEAEESVRQSRIKSSFKIARDQSTHKREKTSHEKCILACLVHAQ